ncbi:MAG: endopeptidase La [Desulfovibrionaceae bacterium]|nr:endopeptidase La [Desulfovibrionaceae bacterium]
MTELISSDNNMKTRSMPLLPLANLVVFPHTILPLFVSRDETISAAERAYKSKSRQLFAVLCKSRDMADGFCKEDMFETGVVCRIIQLYNQAGSDIKVLLEGMYRAKLVSVSGKGSSLTAQVEPLSEVEGNSAAADVTKESIRQALLDIEGLDQNFMPEVIKNLHAVRDGAAMADSVMMRIPAKPRDKQQVLEMLDISARLEAVYVHLKTAISNAQLEKIIKKRTQDQMEKNQRDYYLTEKLRVINKELGRECDPQEELDKLEKALKEKELPDAARERGLAEIKKLRSMTPMAPEYTILRTYIDWILALPWNKMAAADIDLAKAKAILDNNHYGIEKPKERILEYLAVQKLSHGIRGPILCLVGPPGVGKTSLAKSVAEATGREYLRLSLGGVRDEAEIRGHRRTYVGALPGKIIQSLKRVKTGNPLFCLDEIDKLTNSERGDPAAALLEVLDPEQNKSFMDHYMDLDYDLSKVFFITTANSLDSIPAPLLDRMEVIRLHSYLETEKFHIARQFLLPKQIEENSIKESNLRVSDETLKCVLREYTSEAGVRSLERRIAKLCRTAAVRMLERNDLDWQFDVTPKDLPEVFGAPTSRHDTMEKKPAVGVCTGLAWTAMGGEILFVETGIMAGTGQVSTTGKLGDVMQESCKAALSYVRAHAAEFGLAPDFHKKADIHVHVPDGATPKDGPSAGITIATAITSALLNIPVRNDVAMTGEISLRGRVLPIGGLREKLLAARRAGIMKVIVPEDNRRDLIDIPKEVTEGMELVFVSEVSEVLPLALDADKEAIFPGSSATPLYKELKADAAKAGKSPARKRTAASRSHKQDASEEEQQ